MTQPIESHLDFHEGVLGYPLLKLSPPLIKELEKMLNKLDTLNLKNGAEMAAVTSSGSALTLMSKSY